MPYKVFLVEDEIVTREGIRDNVDWASLGFEFCGEASDGEVALPQIEATHPDVVITDIKMPFMDGLMLIKILRERMPGLKIIILSGHDEFHYAQEAVKLGVSEYLLKPIGAKELREVLAKVGEKLEQERSDEEKLKNLKAQIADNRPVLQEKFLLRLVTGTLSSVEAVKQSHQLELDIIAPFYLVLVVKLALRGKVAEFDSQAYQVVRRLIAGLLENNPDVFFIRKDIEELVLLLKGNRAEVLTQEASFLLELINYEVAQKTNCQITVSAGRVKNRLGDIQNSFTEAQAGLKDAALTPQTQSTNLADRAELLKLDKVALEKFLAFGNLSEFDVFFEAYLKPLSQAALGSYLFKNYVFVDLVLTTAKFVYQLGGNVDQVIPEIDDIETRLMNISSIEQVKTETGRMFASALAFRNNQQQSMLAVNKAKEFINTNFANPDLSLTDVANRVNLSSSHLSTLFSQETEQTFKEYLTGLRIDKAKELLNTTALKSSEIAERVGYNDPHYFSTVFKKSTGFSPRKFRLHSQLKSGRSKTTGSGGAL